MKGKLDPAWKTVNYAQILVILTGISLVFSIPIFLAPAPVPSILTVVLIALILVISTPSILWINAFYNYFSFEVGSDFVRTNRGVITKKETKIPYGRIQDVNLLRGPFQRLFGIATVELQTAGTSVAANAPGKTVEGEIPGVRDPEKIIDAVMKNVMSIRSEASGLGGSKDVQVLILEELKNISRKMK